MIWEFIDADLIGYNLAWHYFYLVVLCLVNLSLYILLEIFLPYLFPKFADLSKSEKKYTVKNLTKSFILLIILFVSTPVIWNVVFNGVWDNRYIHIFGTVYMSTDVTGLLFVPNLSSATKLHHTTVWIFSTLSMVSDYTLNGLHRALVVLCFFSAIPYLVNAYLGLRHLNTPYIKQKIVDIALYTYANSVAFNVVLQHLYVFRWVPFHLISAIYLGLYYLILYDDIKLIRYLYFKYKNPTKPND